MAERKGASRTVNVKLLDVTEVQRMNDIEAKKKQHSLSPEAYICSIDPG